jgi:hypothetical protein
VEKLNALNTLLEMTKEAERLASQGAPMERIKALIVEIRRKAREEHEGLRLVQGQRESQNPTRFELCMIGIREEFSHGRKSIPNLLALGASFRRIHEEIERTIKEIKATRQVM